MIRNPKDFEVWSACPSGVHSVITELEILPGIMNKNIIPLVKIDKKVKV